MNLKLKRLVRTPASEQYALFDLDQLDGVGQPATIGKLDLHYTNEGMYGTLLLWDESIRSMTSRLRRTFVRALLSDLAQPMGVPNEFVVEFFAPSLNLYDVIHNVGLEDDEEDPERNESWQDGSGQEGSGEASPDEYDPEEDDPEGDMADIEEVSIDVDEPDLDELDEDDLGEDDLGEDDLDEDEITALE